MASVSDVAIVPASEALSKVVEEIFETMRAAKAVLTEKDSFSELASYLERIIPLLRELTKKNINNNDTMNKVVDVLSREVTVAKKLTVDCGKRNRVYLLMNCRKIIRKIKDITREIGQALGLIPLASLDLSSCVNEEINRLSNSMLSVEFRTAVLVEDIMQKIDFGIQERNVDRAYANNLLVQIAKTVGISIDHSSLKKELEEFKKEIEDARLRKDLAESIQMEQIIALLGWADAASSPREKQKKYYTRKASIGHQILEPLQSFYCPITHEVMVDPVEISSGQTFERSAIERWFADGKDVCPLTMKKLTNLDLRSNITLRKSIEEWKDRNTVITMASWKQKLQSNNEQEVFDCLERLHILCEERDLHREWVVYEDYIPALIECLASRNSQIRCCSLNILTLLAKDNDENKVKIVDVSTSIESIVRSLGRHIGEGKCAVNLLLELSKNEIAKSKIGKVQGCILLLATITTGDDCLASNGAMKVLDNLSFVDENVVQMAKANYYKPLLQQISLGSDIVKKGMIKALDDMELTDHSKSILFQNGILQPLLELILNGDVEVKTLAAKVLSNLSSIQQNALQIIREGKIALLIELLYSQTSIYSQLHQHIATMLKNISLSTVTSETSDNDLSFLCDESIVKLFSMIPFRGPDIQQNILCVFHALCRGCRGTKIRSKIRQVSDIHTLVQFFDQNEYPQVRLYAVRLFFCFTEDKSGSNFLENMDQSCVKHLLQIITSSEVEEEVTDAMGILRHIPVTCTSITQWLLDAGALREILHILNEGRHNAYSKIQLIENTIRVLCRFTLSSHPNWQKLAVESGTFPILLHFISCGTPSCKKYAALCLSQLSKSSSNLSKPLNNRHRFLCFSPPSEPCCPVHKGICSMEGSFCLVEAGALEPLVRLLSGTHTGACREALRALSTLIDGDKLQDGMNVIAQVNGINPIISLLNSPSTELQEMVLGILERIFGLDEFRQRYGSNAQIALVEITQRGNSSTRSIAARVLAHLNVLQEQSSYF